MALIVGESFSSYSELTEKQKAFEQVNNVLFVKKSSRKISPFHPECDKLTYDFVHFECKQGKQRETKSKGIRPNQRTVKMNCKAYFRVTSVENNGEWKLRVTGANHRHENHPVDQPKVKVYLWRSENHPDEIRMEEFYNDNNTSTTPDPSHEIVNEIKEEVEDMDFTSTANATDEDYDIIKAEDLSETDTNVQCDEDDDDINVMVESLMSTTTIESSSASLNLEIEVEGTSHICSDEQRCKTSVDDANLQGGSVFEIKSASAERRKADIKIEDGGDTTLLEDHHAEAVGNIVEEKSSTNSTDCNDNIVSDKLLPIDQYLSSGCNSQTDFKMLKQDNSHQCSKCALTFVDHSHLDKHIRSHATAKYVYECSICHKSFSSKSVVLIHMRVHIGKKPFRCTLCGKVFSERSNIQRHLRTHVDEKACKCDFCEMSFRNESDNELHMKIHGGERPNQCSIHGEEFTECSNVQSHKSFHTAQKASKCSLCGKLCSNNSILLHHMKSHTAEKAFHYTTCGNKFSQLSSKQARIVKHMRLDPKINHFPMVAETNKRCAVCESRFLRVRKKEKTLGVKWGLKSVKTSFQCKGCKAYLCIKKIKQPDGTFVQSECWEKYHTLVQFWRPLPWEESSASYSPVPSPSGAQ